MMDMQPQETFHPLVVTASPPTSVSHSAKGSLTHPRDTNLVVCKCTSLDVFRLTPRGIVPLVSHRLFARILLLHLFRPPGRSTDLLLLVSDRFQYALLAWDTTTHNLVTEHAGSLEERAGRKLDDRVFAFVDPAARLVGLVLYQGLLSVVPLSDMGRPKDALCATSLPITSVPNASLNNTSKGKGKAKAASTHASSSSSFSSSPSLPAADVPARFTLRMQELNVLSMCALHTTPNNSSQADPTVASSFAVLFQDVKGDRHLRTYSISTRDKELLPGPMDQVALPKTAHLLVPLQAGGVLVFDHRTITYVSGDRSPVKSAPCKLARDAKIKTYSFVDPSQLLVGDLVGNYTLVHVDVPSKKRPGPIELHAYYMGSTTTCTTLTYIDAGYTYLGSHYGDSSLIRLLEHPTPQSNGSLLQVVETYANLGPISDFVLMDAPGSHGLQAPQIVTCSGAFHNGSLRVVRHGVEITPLCHVPTPPVPSRVITCAAPAAGVPPLVFLSLGTATSVVLSVTNEGEVVEVDASANDLDNSGLVTDSVTLAAGWMALGDGTLALVQVTPYAIHVYAYAAGTFARQATWHVPEGPVHHAVLIPTAHTVVAAVQAAVFQVHVDLLAETPSLQPVHKEAFPADVAALDVNADRGLAAVALWNRQVYVYFWPTPEAAAATAPVRAWARAMPDPIELADYEARSVVVAYWPGGGAGTGAGATYVLCGRGDGNLVAYELGPAPRGVRAGVPRMIGVGTQPVRLVKFLRAGKEHVFGACDHPIVVRASESGKLVYSNVNVANIVDVGCMPLAGAGDEDDEAAAVDTLFIATPEGLTVGTMDQVENVHVAMYPLGGEMPRRIAHHAPSKTLVVLTERLDDSAPLDVYAEEQAFVKVFDEVSMECIASQQLQPTEAPQCMCLHQVVGEHAEQDADDADAKAHDANVLVAIGTAYVVEGEEEPTKGRILLFKIDPVDKALVLVSVTTVKGAVYSLASLGAAAPGKLVAGVNNRVVLFDTPRGTDLPRLASSRAPAIAASRVIQANTPMTTPELQNAVPSLHSNCNHAGFIMALFLEVHGNLIVVGDLMKSVAILEYNAATNSLGVVAKDPSPSWVTAIAAVDADHALVADTEHNLYVTRRPQMGQEHAQAALAGALKPRLEIAAEFHLGEFVNRFRAGYLRPPADEARVLPRFISASVNGHLGIVAHVPDRRDFDVLIALNAVLGDRVLTVGDFKYDEWRKFHSPRKVVAMHGAVDGDLVQRFNEFDRDVQSELVLRVAKKCKREGELTVEEVSRLVEDVLRLH